MLKSKKVLCYIKIAINIDSVYGEAISLQINFLSAFMSATQICTLRTVKFDLEFTSMPKFI